MSFDALAGNEALRERLSQRAARGDLGHAYLISGPVGSGRTTLARLMAAAMVCTGNGKVPCGVCAGCKKALSGIHPDVTAIGGDSKEITVGQARTLRADAYIRPNEAPRKVYLIQNAQNMNNFAQNALLKVLEDGPAYAAFLLIADNPSRVLPTIRSRCEELFLSPVTPRQAEAYLVRRFGDKPQVREAAAGCGGILGRAVERLEGEQDLSQVQEAALKLAAVFADADEPGLMQLCVGLERWSREDFSALLSELLLLVRHALALQAGTQAEVPAAALPAARRLGRRGRRELLEAAGLLEELGRAGKFNVGVGHLAGALCAGLGGL